MFRPNRILLACGFVFETLAALAALGVPSSWRVWEIPGGLACLLLAMLID